MPEYQMDKSGRVDLPPQTSFRDLSYMVQGFIEAAFFTSECPGVDTEEFNTPEHQSAMEEGTADGSIPGDCGFSDLEPDSLRKIVELCDNWEKKAAALLEKAYARDYNETQAGRDLWFTLGGHGVGYWSRDELNCDSPEYERLTQIMVNNRDNPKVWDDACAKRSALSAESLGAQLTEAAGRRELYLYYENGKVCIEG